MDGGIEVRVLVEGFWDLWLFGRRKKRIEWIGEGFNISLPIWRD